VSKGAVIAAVAAGAVVILGGAALALASSKPNPYPNLGAPPPPPPVDSLGRYLVQQGGAALDELGHNDYVKTYTGGEKAAPYIVKNLATGGLYGTAKGVASTAKKIIGSLF